MCVTMGTKRKMRGEALPESIASQALTVAVLGTPVAATPAPTTAPSKHNKCKENAAKKQAVV